MGFESSVGHSFHHFLVILCSFLKALLKIKRHEEHSSSFVELRLELHPVQPERVKESRESFHEAKDADGEDGPEGKDEIYGDSADAQRIVGEDEEDALVQRVPAVRVDHLLLDVHELDEHVALGHSPEHGLKGEHPGSVKHSGSDVELERRSSACISSI